MALTSDRSQLQTQMGQEVIYLLLTSSMLGCILLAAYVLLNMRSPSELDKELARVRSALAAAQRNVGEFEDALRAAKRRIADLQTQVEAKNPIDKPPIINLPEAEGFTFVQGSAEISAAFEDKIRNKILPDIVDRAKAYNAKVIEIIGHTDGVPVGPNLKPKSNLDLTIQNFVDGLGKEVPVPYDNAGLGMIRAAAVAKLLKQIGLGDKFEILPLSAGSLIALDDRYSPGDVKLDDQTRRRIEIRLRRRHEKAP